MSAPQWLRTFGLSQPPFTKELGDDELWVPSSRERVVDAIVEACQQRGHVLSPASPAWARPACCAPCAAASLRLASG